MRNALSLLAMIILLTSGATAGTYFVSNDGDNGNPGTIELPFATIQKAADTAKPGNVVNIRGGTYRETVKPAREGTKGAPVRFTAYEGEEVVLSGCVPVTGWTRHDGDIWKTANTWDVGRDGAGNTLFVDGRLEFEARHHADTDPIDIDDWGDIDQLTKETLAAGDLEGFGDDYWNGAKVRHHINDWTVVSNTIADYDSDSGTITFARPYESLHLKTSGYYLYDTLKALDKPGEWFKDRAAGVLYYMAEPGQDPNDLEIEFKKYGYAFDLRGRDHIRLDGFTFRGVGIQTDGDTDHNLYDRNRFYAFDKGKIGGLSLSGDHNVFRDNEVHQTWGGALSIGGMRNQLVNNYLHDIGYRGTARVISMGGAEHLVSHNTVRTFARSFLDGYPNRTEFAYNLFEDGGNLSWDTGVFDGDGGGGSGGNSIVHHNLFRHHDARGIYMAFYTGGELVIHHNIVHDTRPSSVGRGYLTFHKYFHNTFVDITPRGNAAMGYAAMECNYNNNIQMDVRRIATLGVDNRGNHDYVADDFVDIAGHDFRLAAGSGAIDKGVHLPGINDGFKGAAPDAGALEYGEAMWKVGHDFTNKPKAVYAWKALPETNIFNNSNFRSALSGWTYIGRPLWYQGNAWNTRPFSLSFNGNGCVQIEPGEGMKRTFTGLKPDTWYTVGALVKMADERANLQRFDDVQGPFAKGNYRGEAFIEGLADGQWVRIDGIDFSEDPTKYNQVELLYSRPPGKRSDLPVAFELRRGSLDGPLMGTFSFRPMAETHWNGSLIDIDPLAGKHDLFFVAQGPGAERLRLASLRLRNAYLPSHRQVKVSVRRFGGPPVSTFVGLAEWNLHLERFTFKTGAENTSAEVFIMNDSPYDAYLDQFVFFEKEPFTENAAYASGSMSASSVMPGCEPEQAIDGAIDGNGAVTMQAPRDSWLAVDLGRQTELYGIRIVAPGTAPLRLNNFRISVWDDNPRAGGNELWGKDYLREGSLMANETLALKATELSGDGTTELRDVTGRYVQVQLKGTNAQGDYHLALAELEVLAYDDLNLIDTDGAVTQTESMWQVAFPQQITIGELTLHHAAAADYRELGNFKVTVWDREPSKGGKQLWEKAYFPEGSVGQGEAFTIEGGEIGADGSTRLASVLAYTVRVENDGPNAAGNRRLPIERGRIVNGDFARLPGNAAIAGVASQSGDHYFARGVNASQLRDYYLGQGLPRFANDGLAFPLANFTTAKRASGAWWQVDLGRTVPIDQIVVFNRLDAGERIGEFRVSVWDGDPEGGATELWGRDYSYGRGDIIAGGSLAIDGDTVSGGKRLDEVDGARFVRIQLLGQNILSLSEVQVWTA